jgi:glycosyltransferase involved in cell wall biosynthesis
MTNSHPINREPMFSIIIPVFNREALIKSALDSIAGQWDRDFEVIVADDGSTDLSASIAEQHPVQPRVIRLSGNHGPSAARNAAATSAAGHYLAFLDSDDVFFPWSLATYRHLIETHSSPSFLAGKPFSFPDERKLSRASVEDVTAVDYVDYLSSYKVWPWHGVSSFVVRKDEFLRVGGFEPRRMNGEDADLCLRLGDSPGFVQVMAPVTFGYREHECNLTRQLPLTVAGIIHQLDCERAGRYPGGTRRERCRRKIILRHCRPASLTCARAGRMGEALNIYWRTFLWNLVEGRLKYLCAFPVHALAHRLVRAFKANVKRRARSIPCSTNP